MHKKHQLHKLHSIPIGLWKNRYLVSYSIPLACAGFLLLGLGIMINPSNTSKTSAIKAADIVDGNDKDNKNIVDKDDANKGTVENSNESSVDNNPIDASFGGYTDKPDEAMATNSNEGIMPLADTTSTASLVVGGDALDKTVEVSIGEVAYRKHSISVSVSNMLDYYLVLAGDPNLTLQDNTPTHTIPTVTTNVIGASMPENRWGFAWEKNSNTSEDALTYQPITTSNTTLESNSTLATGSNVNFNGQLNFAAKFGESTVLGKYSSKVSLSLIATPKVVSTVAQWVNASGQTIGAGVDTGTMQGITSGFCKNNSSIGTGYTIKLKDVRDTNTYTIVKLEDGNCWMQQNLRLKATDETGLPLTSNDSDISSNWTLPKTLTSTTTNDFSASNQHRAQSYYSPSTLEEKGVYYSWTAATAGTGTSSITNGDAPSSICPKGWILPSYSEYTNMLNAASLTVGGSAKIRGSYYKFPYVGQITGASPSNINTLGNYWSRTAIDSTLAYALYFAENSVYMNNENSRRSLRYLGFPIRCISHY